MKSIYIVCVRNLLVPDLAAGGPYWVLISQKVGSLLGPYFKAWGSLLVLVTVYEEQQKVAVKLFIEKNVSTISVFKLNAGID